MDEGENNKPNLTLDSKNSDAVILAHNLQVLKEEKQMMIEELAKAQVSVPAALVRMKWQYRREIYAFQVKEEIYGSTLAEIMRRNPQLQEKILAHIEASYQHILAREVATLRLSRKLCEGEGRTANVNIVAREEPTPAPERSTPSHQPEH